ncbi:MAG: hypothetical protein D6731_09705 [Planctomycetota bacterium]|nr:MAG: hypothetical protein D6731_09705 [Planctomycetota bacterium]
MFAVLRRDLQVHFFVVAGGALATLGLLAASLFERFVAGQAVLLGLRSFVVFGLAPFAWLVAFRLHTREAAWGEGAVLEALPVSRRALFLARSLAGAAAVAAAFALGFSNVALGAAALQRELPAALVTSFVRRSAGFLALVYAWPCAAAALGCKRHLAHALLAAVFLVGHCLGFSPPGPLAYPWRDPRVPGGDDLGLALVGAGGLLLCGAALVGSRLARRWERPAAFPEAVAVLGTLCAALALCAALRRPEPFALPGPVARANAGAVTVRVRAAPGADALARRLAADLAALERGLGVRPPAVDLDLAAGLDPEAVEVADLGGADGLLLRAPFTDPACSPLRLRAGLVRAALDRSTARRSRVGVRAFFRAGYPLFLVAPEGPSASRSGAVAWCLERIVEEGLPFAAVPQRWAEVEDWVGERASEDLAHWLLARWADALGIEAVHARARAAFAARSAAACAWGEVGDPRLEASLAGSAERLRAAHRPALEALGARRERAQALRLRRLAGGALRLEGLAALGPGPGHELILLHRRAPIDPSAPRPPVGREVLCAPHAALETARVYPPGARVRWALAERVPALGGEVLLLSWRGEAAP